MVLLRILLFYYFSHYLSILSHHLILLLLNGMLLNRLAAPSFDAPVALNPDLSNYRCEVNEDCEEDY